MAINFDGWQSSNNLITVQNPCYIVNGFKMFLEKYKAASYIFPKGVADIAPSLQVQVQAATDKTLDNIFEVNKSQVRIPGRATNLGIVSTAISSDTVKHYPNAEGIDKRFTGMMGVGYLSPNAGTTTIISDKCRFLPHLTKIGDYVSAQKKNGYNYLYEDIMKYTPSYTENGGYYPTAVDVNTINDDSHLVCDGITVYYYDSGQNKYVPYGSQTYDLFIPLNRTYPSGYRGTTEQIIFIPYLKSLKPYIPGGFANGLTMGFVLTNVFTAFKAYSLFNTEITVDIYNRIIYNASTNYGDERGEMLGSYPNYGQRFFAAPESVWRAIFNSVGWEWSFNENDVTNPDGDVNKPTYPGQPTNPTGGGGGTGDNISDEIPMPSPSFLPNTAAYNRYWLQPSKVSALQQFLLSDTFLNDIKRLWTDPAEYLIKLAYYPFDGQLHDYGGVSSASVAVAGIQSDISALAMLDNYNCKFKGGSIEITEYYGTYLDYSPYTTAEIFIPYVGYKQINLSDVMGKTLEIEYAVDFDTGCITAFVLSGGTPMTMYSAPFGVELSISGTNANQVAQQVLGMIGDVATAAGGVISMVASGGATAPVELPKVGKAVTNIVGDVSNIDIQPRHFGTPSPTTSLFAPQQPFIVLHRPITAEPADFAALNGYSAGYSGKISSFSGYLKCSSVKLAADANITDNEQKEIISLFLGGVYIG